MLKRVSVLGVGLSLIVSGAQAQDAAPRDGFYVRAAAGISFASDLEQDLTFSPSVLFADTPPNAQVLDFDSGFVAGGAIGFDYADGIRTELEYRYMTTSIDSVVQSGGVGGSQTLTPANDDFNTQLLMTNVFYDFRNSSRLTPFVGIGVGGAFTENENGDRDAALAYQGRAGLALALNGGFSIDLEYIYTRSNDLVYGPADEDFVAGGPTQRLDDDGISASSVMLGLRKQF